MTALPCISHFVLKQSKACAIFQIKNNALFLIHNLQKRCFFFSIILSISNHDCPIDYMIDNNPFDLFNNFIAQNRPILSMF
jgi:hypothetical protein